MAYHQKAIDIELMGALGIPSLSMAMLFSYYCQMRWIGG
jgi:hypothetical protein